MTRNDQTKTCQHCDQTFTRKPTQKPGDWRRTKYCSETCRDAAQPKGPAKHPRTGRCLRCGTEVSMQRRFCSDTCHYWAIAERIDRHRDTSAGPDACWCWTGTATQGGYGIVGRTTQGSVVLAHRAAVEQVMGRRLPEGMVAAHHCDTPACANPRHIFVTTSKGNMADASSKGRTMRGPRTRKLDDATARAIRVRYQRGGVTLSELGEEFGLDGRSVHRVVTWQTYRPKWQHVEAPPATIVAGPAPC